VARDQAGSSMSAVTAVAAQAGNAAVGIAP